ncbi:hypothetical protein E0X19_01550 [Salmonella enterica subsp. enterica serovar Agama]|uniref:Uncharacterized protein n=2 Tax=Salmonella enterica I TaxID=59201 RepID=A0A707YRE6_SALTM|nr:hypothetical protein [Salmonella enterica subsp. enterica]EBC9937828.1 hypothetical protein [Salmonella enterica subsp. enterica serovar Agama]ECB6302858.1 hypothetical protein [Salmonella enterica subsp. enterica serovar Durham]ECD4160225.1 hypothetical protein [Salmonella enterica subsp. enterica serovar Tudu]ECG7295457.1 hypothetical protein [Salmonella enterica subsp. enterica serovar Bahati]ECN2763266.1 hypothetical protein [Salmonella enterica subsp. enterica serovar Typhimurium]EDN6
MPEFDLHLCTSLASKVMESKCNPRFSALQAPWMKVRIMLCPYYRLLCVSILSPPRPTTSCPTDRSADIAGRLRHAQDEINRFMRDSQV